MREKEKEASKKETSKKEASKKETSKKRPSKGAAAGNLSKKRKRIQVSSKTIWLKKLKSTIEWYSGIVNISSYFAQECLQTSCTNISSLPIKCIKSTHDRNILTDKL